MTSSLTTSSLKIYLSAYFNTSPPNVLKGWSVWSVALGVGVLSLLKTPRPWHATIYKILDHFK